VTGAVASRQPWSHFCWTGCVSSSIAYTKEAAPGDEKLRLLGSQ
jgi:hypothetical protein